MPSQSKDDPSAVERRQSRYHPGDMECRAATMFLPVFIFLKPPGSPSSNLDGLFRHAFGAEEATVALDFVRGPQRLVGIIGELHRRPAVRFHHLAHQRNRFQFAVRARRNAADKVVGQIGAPTEREIDLAAQGARGTPRSNR